MVNFFVFLKFRFYALFLLYLVLNNILFGNEHTLLTLVDIYTMSCETGSDSKR